MTLEKKVGDESGVVAGFEGALRLFYHPASSASLRVILYLRCRGVPPSHVQLTTTELTTDHRGILVFALPKDDPETRRLGTNDLLVFNPEGRVPILLLPDGRIMTQSGPIIDYIEDTLPSGAGKAMLPTDPWMRAEAQRIAWIVAADIQPYQNIPFIIQAMGDWGMIKAPPLKHPLRVHFVRREFGALEKILLRCAGKFSVGDEVSLADCFLVPQIRNALLAEIDLAGEFPTISRVWENLIKVEPILDALNGVGGVVQPLAFDADKFEVYAKKLT